MHNKMRLRLLKIKHELEGDRQKIRMKKDLFVEQTGKNAKMTKAIGQQLNSLMEKSEL